MISIVCPFFNEEPAVSHFFERIVPIMEHIGYEFEVVCVNDGSEDDTLKLLMAYSIKDKRVRVIDLSRNFGKEAALTAALDYALGEAVIPIDADLQDPPELIEAMVKKWEEGFDVVLAKRSDRSDDSVFKRITAGAFYRVHNLLSKPIIPENVGDFRLMSRVVVDAVRQMPERQRFMKGLFSWVGFKTCVIEYKREKRSAGKSKFNARKLWILALEGITSFSTFPLTVWLYVGGIVAMLSFIYGLFIILRTLISGIDLPGYASLFCLVLFFGGLQLMGIGILGEYLGRTYLESKQRPIYIAREVGMEIEQRSNRRNDEDTRRSLVVPWEKNDDRPGSHNASSSSRC